MLIDQIGQFVHRLSTLRRSPCGPFAFESCSCSGNGGVDIGLTGHLYIVCYERFIVRTVEAEGLARFGVNVLRSSTLANVLHMTLRRCKMRRRSKRTQHLV